MVRFSPCKPETLNRLRFFHRCGSPLFFIGVAHLLLEGTLILVTVDTFDTPNMYGSSKTMTVTGMATATRLIPVTIETFDRQIRYGCRRFFVLTFNAGPCFTSQMEPRSHKCDQMLLFTRARNGVVCGICNLPRGANLADVAIFVASPEFQIQCTQSLNISMWCNVLLPFCNLFQSSTCCYLRCWQLR